MGRGDEPGKGSDHAGPEDDGRGDTVCILAVNGVWLAVLIEVNLGLLVSKTPNGCSVGSDDDLRECMSELLHSLMNCYPSRRRRVAYGHRDGIGKSHDRDDDRGDLPGPPHGIRLGPLGPEQVEEEAGAEDGGDGDADEDVVGGDADVVVVFHMALTTSLNAVLLVNVIWVERLASCGGLQAEKVSQHTR